MVGVLFGSVAAIFGLVQGASLGDAALSAICVGTGGFVLVALLGVPWPPR